MDNKVGIFEEVREFPDPTAARRFASLVGLDEMKDRLLKEARLLLDPESLAALARSITTGRSRSSSFFATALPFSFLRAMSGQARPYWRRLSVMRSLAKQTFASRCTP
jgi:hypothetical protein